MLNFSKIYKFCPKCGNKLLNKKEGNHPRLRCSGCDFIFYQNSKPTSCALIVEEDRVLLGKRSTSPSKNKWDIPGGFLELGEHPETGLKREVLEETGLEIEIVDMIGFFMDTYGKNGDSTLNICYVAKSKGEKIKAADDVKELRWFKIAKLPQNLAFKNTREMLGCLKKWLKKKEYK